MREEYRVGLDYLGAATALPGRPTSFRSSSGLMTEVKPEAALIATDWGNGVALDLIVLPDAKPAWITNAIERGLAYAAESGFKTIDIAVDRTDDLLCSLLTSCSFAMTT